MTFKRASFEKVGDNVYRINGDLTIRDITKKVSFDAVFNGSLKTPRSTVAAWKATLVVNRFDFGLKWDRTIETGGLVAGDLIAITLTLEFQKRNS